MYVNIEDNFTVTTVDFAVEFLHVHLIDSCCIKYSVCYVCLLIFRGLAAYVAIVMQRHKSVNRFSET